VAALAGRPGKIPSAVPVDDEPASRVGASLHADAAPLIELLEPTMAWVAPSTIRNSQAAVSFQKHRAKLYTMRDIMAGLMEDPVPPSLIPDVVQMEDGTFIGVDNTRVGAAKLLQLQRQRVRLLPASLPLPPDQQARFRVIDKDGQVKTAATWGEAVKLRIDSKHLRRVSQAVSDRDLRSSESLSGPAEPQLGRFSSTSMDQGVRLTSSADELDRLRRNLPPAFVHLPKGDPDRCITS
jgi:hypothetical protein